MSILEGNIYLPVCFTCNKRFMSNAPVKPDDRLCMNCSDLWWHEPGNYQALHTAAKARQAEMKYKKD